jgi:TonB-linked SusC/RagA family outer membrane protein
MNNILNYQTIRVMRNTLIFLTICLSAVFAEEANSQLAKINIHLRNERLLTLFDEIEKQTDFLFVYDNTAIDVRRRISMDAENTSVAEVLSNTFANSDVIYAVEGKNIMLMKRMIGAPMPQQTGKRITGIIVDETGEPVPGANVAEKGTTNGISTDADGRFSLTVKDAKAVLRITYIGYATQEITVGNQTDLRITLFEDAQNLDEVVVVAYGTVKKKDLTGSVTSVSADQMKIQQVSSASQALVGLVPGVQFAQSTGQPGAEADIRVRGMGSISGGTSPLVVVDGIPTSMSLNSINPSDIESIVVSKDAASNSLYGSRAANGVLQVTTKKGKTGKPKIDFDVRVGTSSQGVPFFDMITDADKYYEYVYQGNYNYIKYYSGRAEQFKSMSDQELRQYAADNLFKMNGNTLGADNGLGNYLLYRIPEGSTLIDPSTGKVRSDAKLLYQDDWADYFIKTVLRQEYNANISGGTDNMDYYFSLGYLGNPSYVMGSTFDRYSAKMKINTQITKWLKGGMNLSYSRTYSNAPGYSGGTVNTNIFVWLGLFAPTWPLFAHDLDGKIKYDEDGKPIWDLGTGQTDSPLGNTRRTTFPGYSPGVYFDKDLSETTRNNLNGYTYLEATLLNDFKAFIDLNMDEIHQLSVSYGNNESGTAARDYHGTISNSWYRYLTLNSTQRLTYDKNFGSHHVDALIGHEFRWSTSKYMSGSKRNLFMVDRPSLSNALQISGLSGGEESSALEGYLARANYNYAGKYYLSSSIRTDGWSGFRGNKWGTFWSVGGAYRITQESFMQENAPWLNELKLRVNYGTLGNNNIGLYSWTDIWQISNAGSIGTPVLSVSQTAFGNPTLSWEKNYGFDVGLDFIIADRFTGSLDYSNKKTKDMLWSVALAASTGQSSATQNIGEMLNTSLELDLGYDIVKNKDFYWNVGINLSNYKNELTKMPDQIGTEVYPGVHGYVTENYLRGIGKDYFNLYMYRYAGVDKETGIGLLYKELRYDSDLEKYPGHKLGDIVTTTDPNEATRFELGSPKALLYGGFHTNIKFKDFDAGMIASYQLGGKIINLTYQYLTGMTIGRGVSTDMLDTWSPENPNGKYPMRMLGMSRDLSFQPAGGSAGQYSDFYLFNASYLNMKSITLGYTLPKHAAQKIYAQNLHIYLLGENLFLLTAKKGLDPRVSYDGAPINGFGFPQAKSYSIGLNLTF